MTIASWGVAGRLAVDAGQRPPPPRAAGGAQFSTRVDMVLVTATVSRDRRLVRGLPRDAFRIFEDDVSRPVAYFASEDAPLELLVAIDVSSSLRKTIGALKEDACYFVSALPPTCDVTLASFNDEWHTLVEPPAQAEARVRAIEPLTPYGMTSLYDALTHSFDVVGQQLARHGVIVFTDGEDTASHVSADAVDQRIEASDAIVYVIGHGDALRSVELRDLCQRLAGKSGGRAFFPGRRDQLRQAFDEILDELSAQYLLAYQPRLAVPDGKWHRIRVEVGGGRYDVRTRNGYRYDPPSGR